MDHVLDGEVEPCQDEAWHLQCSVRHFRITVRGFGGLAGIGSSLPSAKALARLYIWLDVEPTAPLLWRCHPS